MRWSPFSRKLFAVPAVEMSSTPASARVWASGRRPVLSKTESKARWIFGINRSKLAGGKLGVNGQMEFERIDFQAEARRTRRLRMGARPARIVPLEDGARGATTPYAAR